MKRKQTGMQKEGRRSAHLGKENEPLLARAQVANSDLVRHVRAQTKAARDTEYHLQQTHTGAGAQTAGNRAKSAL